MINDEVVNYVKDQLNAGYSKQDIIQALHEQDWSREEIIEIFDHLKPHKIFPPVDISDKRNYPFLVSGLGGGLVFISALITLFGVNFSTQLIGIFSILLQTPLNIGSLALLFGILMIISALVISKEGNEKLGGLVLIIFSVLIVIGFDNIVMFIGGLLGILGSILSFRVE